MFKNRAYAKEINDDKNSNEKKSFTPESTLVKLLHLNFSPCQTLAFSLFNPLSLLSYSIASFSHSFVFLFLIVEQIFLPFIPLRLLFIRHVASRSIMSQVKEMKKESCHYCHHQHQRISRIDDAVSTAAASNGGAIIADMIAAVC